MNKLNKIILIVLLSPPAFSAVEAQWSYHGLTGPAYWGKLDPAYSTCQTGSQQSPIAIDPHMPFNKHGLDVRYKTDKLIFNDNGHTVRFDMAPGNSIIFQGQSFELVQFHFHAHSEHHMDGKVFPMEIHFVHQDKNGRELVIGVFAEVGPSNHAVASLFDVIRRRSSGSVNLDELLPKDREFYLYQGSLTTPPCSEGVIWVVMKDPISVSQHDISAFSAIYPDNFRPLQQLNKREMTKLKNFN
jgi:carbonic anhydrase